MIKILTWVLFYACTVTAAATAYWFVGDLNANGWVSPAIALPSWVFGPVWTLLYLFMATSAYRISQSKRHELKTLALALWAFQMTLNTLWTPVFFGAFDLSGAFYIIVVLWAAIVAFTLVSWRLDRVASYLFMPYLAWTTYAGILNFAYITIN
jgi:benzodiazapine receptor